MASSAPRKKSSQRGMGRVYKRGPIWWICFYHNGRQYRESAKTEDKQEAVRFLQRRMGEVGAGTFSGLDSKRVTIADLLRLWLAELEHRDVKDKNNPRRRANKHLLRLLGEHKAETFHLRHIAEYRKKREDEGAAIATINRELSILRGALRLGAEADPPLVRRVLKVPKYKEDNVRTGFFEHEEYQAIRPHLETHSRVALVISYHTGIRRGQILSITWDQVDFTAGMIRFRAEQTKQGAAQSIPIYGEMEAELRAAYAERDPKCNYVVQWKGRQIGHFRRNWTTAFRKAGLPERNFHDLRRTAARNMDQAGVSQAVIKSITGHKTDSMFYRYRIVTERDQKEAVKKLKRDPE